MTSWFDIYKLSNDADTVGLDLLKNGKQDELWNMVVKEHSQQDLIVSSDL